MTTRCRSTKANCDTDTRVNSPRLITALGGFTLLRTTVATLSLKIAGAGLGFANSILLARMLGPSEFGVYAVAMSLVNLAATLAVLGLPMLVARETAANAAHDQWNHLKGFLRRSSLDVAGRYRDRGGIHALAGDWRFQSDRVVAHYFGSDDTGPDFCFQPATCRYPAWPELGCFGRHSRSATPPALGTSALGRRLFFAHPLDHGPRLGHATRRRKWRL